MSILFNDDFVSDDNEDYDDCENLRRVKQCATPWWQAANNDDDVVVDYDTHMTRCMVI